MLWKDMVSWCTYQSNNKGDYHNNGNDGVVIRGDGGTYDEYDDFSSITTIISIFIISLVSDDQNQHLNHQFSVSQFRIAESWV